MTRYAAYLVVARYPTGFFKFTGVGPGEAFAWVRIINFISIFRHNIKILDSVGQETNEIIVSFGRFITGT